MADAGEHDPEPDSEQDPGAPIRVLVVEDQAAVRAGLLMILGTADDVQIVGEAADGATAVRMARALRPDLTLMDVRMPGTDGIEATRQIIAAGLGDVLILTTFDIDSYVDDALAAGASGFLLKTVDAPSLIAAVRAVARGDGVLGPEVTRRVLRRFAASVASATSRPADLVPGLDELTPRERDVLACRGEGLANAAIAERLAITEATAKTHVSRVLGKLGLRSRTQAAIAAREGGVLDPAPGRAFPEPT